MPETDTSINYHTASVLMDLVSVYFSCVFIYPQTDSMMVKTDLCVETIEDSLCQRLWSQFMAKGNGLEIQTDMSY